MNQLCRRSTIVLTTIKNITIANEIFSKKGLYILYLNISNLVVRMDRSRKGGEVACYIKKSLSDNHNSNFCRNAAG